MITIERIDDAEIIAKLKSMPAKLRRTLQATTKLLAVELEDYVTSRKLSGQVLKVRTGRLRRSINNSVEATENTVTGKVYSSGDVKYAAIHEYGGTIQIPEIRPTKAQALAFMVGGKQVFAKFVRAHSVHMPERSYLRSSLRENAAHIEETYERAVTDAADAELP